MTKHDHKTLLALALTQKTPSKKTREINTARCMPGLNTYEVPFQLEASWEVTLESEAFPSLGGVALGQILPWEEGVVEVV